MCIRDRCITADHLKTKIKWNKMWRNKKTLERIIKNRKGEILNANDNGKESSK